MALTAQGTHKPTQVDRPAITVTIGERELSLTHAATSLASEAQIVAAIETAASTAGVLLPSLFVHRNRDGSLALAAGRAPDTWPEDEQEALALQGEG